jgi:hypothetical protein
VMHATIQRNVQIIKTTLVKPVLNTTCIKQKPVLEDFI